MPKDVGLNSKHYLTMTIHNNRDLQKIATKNSAHIDYKDFMKKYFTKCRNMQVFDLLLYVLLTI